MIIDLIIRRVASLDETLFDRKPILLDEQGICNGGLLALMAPYQRKTYLGLLSFCNLVSTARSFLSSIGYFFGEMHHDLSSEILSDLAEARLEWWK